MPLKSFLAQIDIYSTNLWPNLKTMLLSLLSFIGLWYWLLECYEMPTAMKVLHNLLRRTTSEAIRYIWQGRATDAILLHPNYCSATTMKFLFWHISWITAFMYVAQEKIGFDAKMQQWRQFLSFINGKSNITLMFSTK